MAERPEFIRHWREIQEADDAAYPGSRERLSIGAPFGRVFAFERFGIHHELLPPGRRTSWPHAHSADDEFVFVIEGTPDAWIDGFLHRLQPGDGIGFKAGTGVAHTIINNTAHDARLLVVGDRSRTDDLIHYPRHPSRNAQVARAGRHWHDAPPAQGDHDGLPDALRAHPVDVE